MFVNLKISLPSFRINLNRQHIILINNSTSSLPKEACGWLFTMTIGDSSRDILVATVKGPSKGASSGFE